MLRPILLALALLLAAPIAMPAIATGGGQTATAAELKIKVRSRLPYRLHLEFYSWDRNHFWPGSGKVYILDGSKYHRFTLGCRQGEKICYGAWKYNNERLHWGVGRGGTGGCADCCFTCGTRGTRRVTLHDIW